MRRRTALVAGGLVAAVVVATVCIVLVISKRPSDCDTVRAMIAHNNQFNEHVESATSTYTQVDAEELRDWALHFGHLARQVRDPALAERAGRLADLAEQTVPLFEQFLADAGAADNQASPPQFIKDYARIAKEFNALLMTFDQNCPA